MDKTLQLDSSTTSLESTLADDQREVEFNRSVLHQCFATRVCFPPPERLYFPDDLILFEYTDNVIVSKIPQLIESVLYFITAVVILNHATNAPIWKLPSAVYFTK